MDWNKGYSATYYMVEIDPSTWRDLNRIEVKSGQIKRSADGLRESATVSCADFPIGVEKWVRIWLDIEQSGSNEHVALFTGLATSPADDFEGNYKENRIEMYSVLKAAYDVALMRGWYAPAGMSGAAVIRQLLSVTPAPVTIADNAPALTNNIIADDQETHLTMIDKVLTAIDWRLRIAGDGSITVEPKNRNPVATFDPLEFDVIENSIKVSADWFDCPNVFMAINDDIIAVARDDSINSPLSTVNRGREVWAREANCELADNETLEQYARRRLVEEQRKQQEATYDRRFMPSVYPGDTVRLHYPVQGLDGLYLVADQTIEMGYSARTSERVQYEREN